LKKRNYSFLKLLITLYITWYFGLLLSVTSHELGHATAAYFCDIPIKEVRIGKKENGFSIKHIPILHTFSIDPLLPLRSLFDPLGQQVMGYIVCESDRPVPKQSDLLISIAGIVTTFVLGCVSVFFTLKIYRTVQYNTCVFIGCFTLSYLFIYFTLCNLIPLPGSDMEHIIALLRS